MSFSKIFLRLILFLTVQFIFAIQVICTMLNNISAFIFRGCGTLIILVTIFMQIFGDEHKLSTFKVIEVLLYAVILFMIPNIIETLIAQTFRLNNKLNQISDSLKY